MDFERVKWCKLYDMVDLMKMEIEKGASLK